MKTYFCSFILLSCCCFFALAQDNAIAYRVTKEYNQKGELIRYDSIKTKKNKWVSPNYSGRLNKEKLDTLLKGLATIGEKMNVFISDSISKKINRVLNDENFTIWMDAFDQNEVEITTEDQDSIGLKMQIKMDRFKANNDASLEQQLEKELKRIQQKLSKIKAKKKAQ